MNNGGEAADQMVREALQFSEVAIKLTALGFKNSLAIALAYAKENPKVRGKTSLDRLLREGKEMKIIPLQTKDLAHFKAYAKQYGVLFASIKDKGAQGEKIDIIEWNDNPAMLIEHALSPAKVISVIADADEKTAKVVVPDYQLSLAIGKEGQNARLAARLTGFKIDIKSETQARESGEFMDYVNDYEDADYDEEYDEEFADDVKEGNETDYDE